MGFFDYLMYNFIRNVQHEKNEQKRKTKKFYQQCMQECATAIADFGDAILKASQKIVDESDPLPKEYSAKGLCEVFLYSAATISRRNGLTNEQIKVIELMENTLKDGISVMQFRQACSSNENLKTIYPQGYLEAESCGSSVQKFFEIIVHLPNSEQEYRNVFNHLSVALANYCYCGNLESDAQPLCEELLQNAYSNFNRIQSMPFKKFTFYANGTLEDNLNKVNSEFDKIAEKSNIRAQIGQYDLMIQYLWAKTAYDLTMMGDISLAQKCNQLEQLFQRMNVQIDLSAKQFMEDISRHGEIGSFVTETYTVTTGILPVFWQVVQSASMNGNEHNSLLSICKDYREVCLNIMDELENDFPKKGYCFKKVQDYSLKLIQAFADFNKS